MVRKRPSRGSRRRGGATDKRSAERAAALQFSGINAILAGAGLVSLVAGYVLLAQGSITAAPLLLVLGYVVLLPLAIIL